MEAEPNITAALRSQSSLVCFSADKLFASTQAGIVIGKLELTEELHQNPICRALRLDKVTMTLLEESALSYLRKDDAALLPLWRQIRTTVAELRERANAINTTLRESGIVAVAADSVATPGGGSLPGGELPSMAIVLKPTISAAEFSRKLLDAATPVIGYIKKQEFYLDLRTVDPAEDAEMIRILLDNKSCLL